VLAKRHERWFCVYRADGVTAGYWRDEQRVGRRQPKQRLEPFIAIATKQEGEKAGAI